MKISISNIAWDVSEDVEISIILKKFNIDCIDVAPGKYFKNIANTTKDEILTVKAWWNARGVSIIGMQALLFGTTGLNIFGDDESRAKMLEHLGHVCKIASHLGATKLTFGSPKNRDRARLADEEVQHIAVSFFRQLGQIAQSSGTTICLETNPTIYDCNFMTNTSDTVQIVKTVNHPSIKMQLDIGAISINKENFREVIESYASLFGHIHISEPNLNVLDEELTDHRLIGEIVKKNLPHLHATIEMRATENIPHVESVSRALHIATKYYGS